MQRFDRRIDSTLELIAEAKDSTVERRAFTVDSENYKADSHKLTSSELMLGSQQAQTLTDRVAVKRVARFRKIFGGQRLGIHRREQIIGGQRLI